MTTFTASEVVTKLRERFASGNDVPVPDVRLTRAEFDVIADRLEAQEKAVPVMVVNHVSSAEHDLPIGMKLYTHPAAADAERLAEALRKIVDTDYVKRCCNNGIEVHYPDAPPEMECCGDPDVDFGPFAQIAMDALTAHSAQAQPPAASVTDAIVGRALYARVPGGAQVWHWLPAEYGKHPHPTAYTIMRAALEAALAAQENPNG